MIEPMTIEQYLDNLKELEGENREEYLKIALANQIEERNAALANLAISEKRRDEQRSALRNANSALEQALKETEHITKKHDEALRQVGIARSILSEMEPLLDDILHQGQLEKELAFTHAQRNNFRATIRIMLEHLSVLLKKGITSIDLAALSYPYDDLPF